MGRKRWLYAPNLGYDIAPFRGAAQELLPEPAVIQTSPIPAPWAMAMFPTRARDIMGSALWALLHHCSVKEERGAAARIHLVDS